MIAGNRTGTQHDEVRLRRQRPQLRDALFGYGDTCRSDPPAFDRLSGVDVPTTLVIGGQDHHSVINCGVAISDRIPGCRTIVLPGIDHLIPLRAPGAVAAAITTRVGRSDRTLTDQRPDPLATRRNTPSSPRVTLNSGTSAICGAGIPT